MIGSYIKALIKYGVERGLIERADEVYCENALLEKLGESSADFSEPAAEAPLNVILEKLCDIAAEKGLIENSVTYRDLFDTALMGVLTPVRPRCSAGFSEFSPRTSKRRPTGTINSAAIRTISVPTE